MPTYSYECTKCGHTFDVFHAMSSQLRVKCERCNGPCIKMIGKGAGIIFKGSGFYETDYKKKSGSVTSSSSETKSESKPAKKAEKSESTTKKESKTPKAAG